VVTGVPLDRSPAAPYVPQGRRRRSSVHFRERLWWDHARRTPGLVGHSPVEGSVVHSFLVPRPSAIGRDLLARSGTVDESGDVPTPSGVGLEPATHDDSVR
jgi:hypothetical protein